MNAETQPWLQPVHITSLVMRGVRTVYPEATGLIYIDDADFEAVVARAELHHITEKDRS